MTLRKGERLKMDHPNLLRGSTQASHRLAGVWEVTDNEGEHYVLKKIGVSGKRLKGERVHHTKENVEENIEDGSIEIKHRDYRPLGMKDLEIEVIRDKNAVSEDRCENNLAVSQIRRQNRKNDEKKDIRKAFNNWRQKKNRWTGRQKELFPENLPLYFQWFNSEDYSARRDEPDAVIKVSQK